MVPPCIESSSVSYFFLLKAQAITGKAFPLALLYSSPVTIWRTKVNIVWKKGTSWDKAMSSSEEIKLAVLSVGYQVNRNFVKFHNNLLEGSDCKPP